MRSNRFRLRLNAFSDAGGETCEEGNVKTGDEGNIEGADAVQTEDDTFPEEFSREQRFSKLITGEFKDEFAKKTQSIIDKRFKETKKLEGERELLSPILQELFEQHKVEPGDFTALSEAVSLSRQQRVAVEQSAQENAKNQITQWIKEGEQLKSVYPSFDFRDELKGDVGFANLIKAGIPVRTAYEVLHKDEILSGAMEYTAKKVSEHVVKGIEAKANRPQENAIGTKGGIIRKTDVNALTSQDIADILKRVEKGACISF